MSFCVCVCFLLYFVSAPPFFPPLFVLPFSHSLFNLHALSTMCLCGGVKGSRRSVSFPTDLAAAPGAKLPVVSPVQVKDARRGRGAQRDKGSAPAANPFKVCLARAAAAVYSCGLIAFIADLIVG